MQVLSQEAKPTFVLNTQKFRNWAPSLSEKAGYRLSGEEVESCSARSGKAAVNFSTDNVNKPHSCNHEEGLPKIQGA